MYYPKPFDDLLEECLCRLATIAQVNKWLGEHVDYYEWCTTIWSLTDLETASEEYAFTCIYEALLNISNLHKLEPRIRAITEEYPGGEPENPEVWKWYKKHEKFYHEHLLLFEPDHQNYEYHMLGQRDDLTVPMKCFRDNAIFLDKNDFTFVFDLVEKYEPLMYKLIPRSVSENPDYIAFIQSLGNETDYASDTEAQKIREREAQWEEEDIIGKSALQHLMNFHETMVDIHELEDWVEQNANMKNRLADSHDPFCNCSICHDFTLLWYDMNGIVKAYHKKNAFRNFLATYESSEKDTRSLAEFFLKNYSLVKSIVVPEGITDVSAGIVAYKSDFDTYLRFHFVFADEPWSELYKDLPWFTGMMNAMYFYLLDRFNAANKSFYLSYDFDKIRTYFADQLIDETAFFFEIYYELATRFPHMITPEGKFLE